MPLILRIQGAFYALTATWALLHVSSFLAFTQTDNAFKTQANGVLFLVFGVFLWKAARDEALVYPGVVMGAATAVFLAGIDLYYLLTGGTSEVFWLDFAAESTFIVLYALEWMKRRRG